MGTPYYMSPECIRGVPYDWSSDIWSLGCLLYELAALRGPFFRAGHNYYTLGKAICACSYDTLPESVGPEIRELVAAMLTAEPRSRPDVDTIYEAACRARQSVALRTTAAAAAAAGGAVPG